MSAQAAASPNTDATKSAFATIENTDPEKNTHTESTRSIIEKVMPIFEAGWTHLERQRIELGISIAKREIELASRRAKLAEEVTRKRNFHKSLKFLYTFDSLAIISTVILFWHVSGFHDPTDARLRFYQMVVIPVMSMHSEINCRCFASTYNKQFLTLWVVFMISIISVVLHTVFTVQDIQWADRRKENQVELIASQDQIIAAQKEVIKLLRQWLLKRN